MEHDILLAKLEHYGICGNANEWLDPTCPTENTMFQLMVMNKILLLFYMVYRNNQSLAHFCF